MNPGHGRKLTLFLSAVAASGLTVALLRAQTDLPRESAFMAGIFVLAGFLWVTEALPLFATSLLVIGLQLLLLANPGDWSGLGFEYGTSPDYRTVLHAAADPVLLLFFGGFLLARAATNEGVDKAMSSLLLRPFGEKPKWVLLGLIVVTAVFSMWMSNSATAAMMIALVAPLLASVPPGDPFRKALVLAVPLGANLGGIGTPIASPPNAVAVGYLAKAGAPIGFLGWMLVAVPLLLILLAFAWMLLWWIYRPKSAAFAIRPAAEPLTGRGWYVVGVFGVTVLFWMTDRLHGLPASVVALIPAIAFTAPGFLNRNDLNSIEWNVLILIAGGIALGAGMQTTGLDKAIVGLLPEAGGRALMAVLVVATIVLGTFMSNTAIANLLLPIGVSAAAIETNALSVRVAVLAIALAASMSMALPISTPPNAIAYSRGELATRDIALCGSLTAAIAALLIIAGLPAVLRLFGL